MGAPTLDVPGLLGVILAMILRCQTYDSDAIVHGAPLGVERLLLNFIEIRRPIFEKLKFSLEGQQEKDTSGLDETFFLTPKKVNILDTFHDKSTPRLKLKQAGIGPSRRHI